jgi:hypothetical protein
MDEQDCHRQTIPGASEYVRVRREDLEVVVKLVETWRQSKMIQSTKTNQANDRLKAALET